MQLSVIVATWNNCERLAISLDALSRCQIPAGLQWEVVLVANNCTDATPRVAERLSRSLPLVYVEEPRQGLSRARNAGIGAARGELIVFADDDMSPCQEWIAEYWRAYREKSSGWYFGGPIQPEYEDADPELLRHVPFASVVGLDWGSESRPLTGHERVQSNWACPAGPLREAGGFDLDLGLDVSLGRQRLGEEFDLMDRVEELGLSPWYLPRAGVVHFVPARKCTLSYLAERVEAHGTYALRAAKEFDPGRYHYVAPFLRDGSGLRSWWDPGHARVRGVPLGLLARLLAVRLRLAVRRRLSAGGIDGVDACRDYFAWRFGLGMVREMRNSGLGSEASLPPVGAEGGRGRRRRANPAARTGGGS